MFTKVRVQGYKSFRNDTHIPLKELTILAGSNSSGKSSAMQPLLLFKQTLLSNSDPGAIRLDGPNVIFSRGDQMYWHAPGEGDTEKLEFGVEVQVGNLKSLSVDATFQRRAESRGLPPISVASTRWRINDSEIALHPKMNSEEIINILKQIPQYAEIIKQWENQIKEKTINYLVERRRSFLIISVQSQQKIELFYVPLESLIIEQQLRTIIHVPGLRGNPERSYPVRAVGNEYPGLFQDYVASLIARWQRNKNRKLQYLKNALSRMKLTWNVRAYQRSDTEVELQVGRTVKSRRGGAKDVVNIADVGFGLSQSLPVIVALIAAEPGQTVYIEQPEIHLHPDAQVALADIISETVKSGVQVIVETHSHLMLMAFQRSIAKGILSSNKAILHWFERDEKGVSNITSTTFADTGAYENTDIPVDFADVSMGLMRDYFEAANR